MNLPAENTIPTTDFFESKEHYLAFRKAWSNAMNSDEKHNLEAYHHVLYAALRQRNYLAGFSPIVRESKLLAHWDHSPYRNGALVLDRIMKLRDQTKAFLEGSETGWRVEYINQMVNEALKPFDGAVTPEMLLEVGNYIADTNPELYESNGWTEAI